jgi:antitoxin component HigA of HigAB toxin-antitoxin module
MQQHSLRQADLAAIFGSQSNVSEVLNDADSAPELTTAKALEPNDVQSVKFNRSLTQT